MMRLSSPTRRTARTRLPLACSARRSEACLVRRFFVNANPLKGFSLTAMWKINFQKLPSDILSCTLKIDVIILKRDLRSYTLVSSLGLLTTSRSSDPQNRYRYRVIVRRLASYYKGSVRTRCGWFSHFATHRFFLCVKTRLDSKEPPGTCRDRPQQSGNAHTSDEFLRQRKLV
jgi:hypothetical protein